MIDRAEAEAHLEKETRAMFPSNSDHDQRSRMVMRMGWDAAVAYFAEEYPIGEPVLDAEGQPLRRCTSCGVPRGTLRHSLLCKAGTCSDPDGRTAKGKEDSYEAAFRSVQRKIAVACVAHIAGEPPTISSSIVLDILGLDWNQARALAYAAKERVIGPLRLVEGRVEGLAEMADRVGSCLEAGCYCSECGEHIDEEGGAVCEKCQAEGASS